MLSVNPCFLALFCVVFEPPRKISILVYKKSVQYYPHSGVVFYRLSTLVMQRETACFSKDTEKVSIFSIFGIENTKVGACPPCGQGDGEVSAWV
jgi:hypothetical protein